MTTTTTTTPPANCSLNIHRFHVRSSDAHEQARDDVYGEKDLGRVIWYKERFLADEEIVEHVVHNATSTILWTIHRPKRGWYIRIRSPRLFPPGIFIPLTPVPANSIFNSEAALSFKTRTNIPEVGMEVGGPGEVFSFQERERPAVVAREHSYPPSRPPSLPSSPSPSTKTKSLASTKTKPPMPGQICEFILSPYSTSTTTPSFFARALSQFTPSTSNSFTLSRVSSAPPPYTPPVSTPSSPPYAGASTSKSNSSSLCPPLLVFTDETPLFSMSVRSGMIEISKSEERLVGVDTSFWIAVALTYGEFLRERGGYLAAMSD